MKFIKPITILLIACFQFLSSFSQTSPLFNYLPAAPKAIIKINPARLGQKIKWQEVMQYKMFQDLVKELPGDGKTFLNDPSQTGIDLSQGIFVAISQPKDGQTPEQVIYCMPKDTARFNAMIKKLMHGKPVVRTAKGNVLTDKKTVVAWNKEIVMISGVSQKPDLADPTKKPKPVAASVITKQLTEMGKALLNKKETVPGDEKFLSHLNQEADIVFWMDNNMTNAGKTKVPPAFGIMNQNVFRKGNYAVSAVNFENGEIVMKMRQFLSGMMDSLYKKFPVKNINTEITRRLPMGQPIAVGSFSFSPEMLMEIYAKIGFDKLIDSVTKHKIQINELLPAIKGDFMVSAIKVETIDPEDSVSQAMGGLQIFVAGTVNDRQKFDQLVKLIQQPKQDSNGYSQPKKMKPVILTDGSIFVFSLSQQAAQKFLSSAGTNEETEKMISPYKKSQAAIVIDLHTVFGFLGQSMMKDKPEEEAKKASEVFGMFDKMIIYGGDRDDNTMETTMHLTLTNKTENSLKQFLNLIEMFYSMKPKSSMASN